MPVSKIALLASAILHVGILAALAWSDSSAPRAPGVSGGGGGGWGAGFPIEISIAHAEDRPRLPDPAPPAPPAPPVPPPPSLSERGTPELPIDEESEACAPSPSVEEHVEDQPLLAADAPPAPAPAPDALVARSDAPAAGGGAPGEPGAEGPVLDEADAIRPVYPPRCLRERHEGTALVRFRVAVDGRAEEIEVVRSAGCPDLDRAAIDAVRRARFRPARRWGTPVAVTVEQPFRFVIKR